MQDRIPTPGQEGRVLITPENGSAPFYAKVEMADNPTQDGTPYNKQAVLQDSTAALFGLDNTAVPNDIFQWIYNKLFSPQSAAQVWTKVAEATSTSSRPAVFDMKEGYALGKIYLIKLSTSSRFSTITCSLYESIGDYPTTLYSKWIDSKSTSLQSSTRKSFTISRNSYLFFTRNNSAAKGIASMFEVGDYLLRIWGLYWDSSSTSNFGVTFTASTNVGTVTVSVYEGSI